MAEPFAEPRLNGCRAGRQDTRFRQRHIGDQSPSQFIVVVRIGRKRHSEKIRAVQQSDGQDLAVAAPRPNGRRCRVRTEPPVPTQVTWVQLYGRPVVLPLPQHVDHFVQAGHVRSTDPDCHPPIEPGAQEGRIRIPRNGLAGTAARDRPFGERLASK